MGNKLESEKCGFVQTLREKTLNIDCKRGNKYYDFWVKIMFKVHGNKIKNKSIAGFREGLFVQGFGVKYRNYNTVRFKSNQGVENNEK